MLRTVTALALAASLAVFAPRIPAAAADAAPRAIDPAASSIRFSVQHVFVEHVTGAAHVFGGSVALDPGSVIPTAANATIDATKVDTGDRDRDASLQSADFFDTRKFPIWTFASTKITPTGPSSFRMDGDLTVHGVTQPEHVDVTVRGTAAQPLYHAIAHIDRHAFGMAVTRIDPAIGGTVDLILDIALKPEHP